MAKKKTIYEHAMYELQKCAAIDHPDPKVRKIATDTLALVKRFEKQDHTEFSGEWVSKFFNLIVNRKSLTPLTDDPDEWEKFEITTKNQETQEEETSHRWQSRRQPSVMSEDQGKTWVDLASGESGKSLDHVEDAKKRAADREEAIKQFEEQKAKAKKAADTERVNPDSAKVEDAPKTATEKAAAEDQAAKDAFDPARENDEKQRAEVERAKAKAEEESSEQK